MADLSNIQRISENIKRLQSQNVPPNDIQSYLKSEGYTPTRFEAAVSKERELGGPPIKSSFMGPFMQGLTLNTADEIEAAFRAGAITGPQYQQQLARVRAGIEEYTQQYPGRAIAGEVLGSLAPVGAALIAAPFTGGATLPAAGTAAARLAPTLAGQAIKGLGYGAATGAIGGAGGATGGLESRLMGGAVGGTIGSVMGGAAPLATTAIGTGGRKLLESTGIMTPQGTATKAQELIARALQREQINPADLATRQANIVRTLGAKNETLADIGGESMRRLARGAMAVPSGAQTEVRNMLYQRAQEAGPRISKDITDLTAVGPRNIEDVIAEIVKRRSDAASPLYQQAYAFGTVDSPAIKSLLEKSKDIQSAITQAKRLPEYADLPDNHMIMLDKAYKYVGGMANELKRSGKSEQARDLEKLRIDLKSAMTDKNTGVPVYGEALKAFSGESLLKDALDAGSTNFLKKTPDEIKRELAKLTNEGEKEMYRLGAIQNLRDDIYNQRETANIADKYLGKGIMKDRLSTVFNSTGEYESFIKNLERERQMGVTRSRIEGGSPTAPIQQDIAEMAGPSPTEILSAGAQMAGGNILGGGANLFRQMGPRLQGINQNVAEELSRSVLNPSFTEQQSYLLGLTPVMDELRKRALQQSMRQSGYSATAGGAMPGVANMPGLLD